MQEGNKRMKLMPFLLSAASVFSMGNKQTAKETVPNLLQNEQLKEKNCPRGKSRAPKKPPDTAKWQITETGNSYIKRNTAGNLAHFYIISLYTPTATKFIPVVICLFLVKK